MSSRVRAPRGAPGRVHPVVAPGCSSVWTEHPVRSRGVSGSSPFNQTSGELAPHHSGVVQWHGHSALNRETVVRTHLPEHRRGPVNASSCRSSSIGRAPSCHGGGNGIETRLWRQTLVVKRTITGDYESPVPGSSPGRGAIHLVVAQTDKSAAVRGQRPLVRVQSTRPRRHSSVGRAQPRYG
jgi:hypothetical protein